MKNPDTNHFETAKRNHDTCKKLVQFFEENGNNPKYFWDVHIKPGNTSEPPLGYVLYMRRLEPLPSGAELLTECRDGERPDGRTPTTGPGSFIPFYFLKRADLADILKVSDLRPVLEGLAEAGIWINTQAALDRFGTRIKKLTITTNSRQRGKVQFPCRFKAAAPGFYLMFTTSGAQQAKKGRQPRQQKLFNEQDVRPLNGFERALLGVLPQLRDDLPQLINIADAAQALMDKFTSAKISTHTIVTTGSITFNFGDTFKQFFSF